MGQMATGGGRISLPLAVGVDRSHPQAAGSGSRPPPVAGSIYLFFFFFFVRWFAGETNKATESGRIYLLFFFFFAARNVAGGGRWVAALFAGGGRWVIHLVAWLIRCFDFILNLCIFLKMVRRQHMNGGQKTPPFCHDRMAAALMQGTFWSWILCSGGMCLFMNSFYALTSFFFFILFIFLTFHKVCLYCIVIFIIPNIRLFL
jgi:hypothetical protein